MLLGPTDGIPLPRMVGESVFLVGLALAATASAAALYLVPFEVVCLLDCVDVPFLSPDPLAIWLSSKELATFLGILLSYFAAGLPPWISTLPRGVHCENIRKQRARKYRVNYIHKRKNLEFS